MIDEFSSFVYLMQLIVMIVLFLRTIQSAVSLCFTQKVLIEIKTT